MCIRDRRSLERRVSESFTAKILTLGSVRLDQEEQELVAGNAIRLSSRETKLMAHFMLNPAKKLTTEHLFKTIWEDEEDAVSYTHLDVYKRQILI